MAAVIDEAHIDSDEGGFVLVLTGDLAVECEAYMDDLQAPGLCLRLGQDAALQLLAQCQSELGPWAAERENAWQEWRVSRAAGEIEDDDECGYAVSDPKHPGWSRRMADAADLARKREKGE